MLTPPEYRAAVDTLCLEFGLSVTSGRRTDQHSIDVGGFAGDPHSWGAGTDTVPIVEPERRGDFLVRAHELGIMVLWEHGSQHLQPIEWSAGARSGSPPPGWEGMHA